MKVWSLDDKIETLGESCSGSAQSAGLFLFCRERPDEMKRKREDRCPLQRDAQSYLATLGLNQAYLNPEHDRCYCSECYREDWPDSIANEGPTSYIIPRGWCRFGVQVPPRAAALDVFKLWSVSFHGVKRIEVLHI